VLFFKIEGRRVVVSGGGDMDMYLVAGGEVYMYLCSTYTYIYEYIYIYI
jgi:hypothetical protein